MSKKRPDLGEELRLLAEAVLERVEPALRGAALGHGRDEWSDCGVCPVCAIAAILRGEQNALVSSLAEQGTALVTILREAIAGVPVAPRYPHDFEPDDSEPNDAEAGEEPANGNAFEAADAYVPPHPHGFVSIPVTIRG
ncbi:hypothetical protein FOS14_05535 [Skermania sp. ID1734]|uniref:hypothetical protein n=1 Tax=Skermania sp. ID1734 TaxID=2597516 RepID=UPI00117BED7C|nr:hypothetical protein [Skermania sp. ID1734]TSE01199.1 hypothetical protein FOS14_05535 [Skermania sp. ID1734]